MISTNHQYRALSRVSRGRLILSAGLSAAMLSAVSGCGNGGKDRVKTSHKGPRQEKNVIVEQAPPLTASEREARFKAAYQQGLDLARREEFGMAVGAFEEALIQRPDDPDAQFNLAACYESCGDPVRAIGIYRRLLDINPNDADCHLNMGTCYIKMYHREKSPAWRKLAREAWQKALELNPKLEPARRYLAQSDSDL